MYRFGIGLLALLLAHRVVADEPGGPMNPDEDRPKRISISLPAEPFRHLPLANALQVDPLDTEPGNAAFYWIRAGRAASQVKRIITEDEEKWASSPVHGGVPLGKLPQDGVEKLLEPFAQALRTAHDAARRAECNWEEPPLTVKNFNDYLPLDDIQSMRTLAQLLRFEHRLALARGDWPGAFRSVRTGLTMARHLGRSHLLISHLVGIAIEAIMVGRIEEMLAQPGCPNLYWVLTDLPSPLVDVRTSIRYELNTFHRSFPALRQLEQNAETPLTQGEILAMFSQATSVLEPIGKTIPSWQKSLALTAIVGRYYGQAKREMLERGVPLERIEKLPTAQVVALYFLNDYNRFRDGVLKVMNLPYWQAKPFLEKIDKEFAARMKEQGNPFLMLMPAITKVFEAGVRSQRNLAILRTVELIRLHASENGGALPATLNDIKVAPLPIDPTTGKTFAEYYRRTETGASLEVPAILPMPVWSARYFDFTPGKKEKP